MNSTALALQGGGVDTTAVAIAGSAAVREAATPPDQPVYMAPAGENMHDGEDDSSSDDEADGELEDEHQGMGPQPMEEVEDESEAEGGENIVGNDVDGDSQGMGGGGAAVSEASIEESDEEDDDAAPTQAALHAAGLESDEEDGARGRVRAAGRAVGPKAKRAAPASEQRGSKTKARRGTIQAALRCDASHKRGGSGAAAASGASSQSMLKDAGKVKKRKIGADHKAAKENKKTQMRTQKAKKIPSDRGKAGVTRLACAEKNVNR